MPDPEESSLLINCSNGIARNNASWILSRLLHDHEMQNRIDARDKKVGGRAESIRIDVFELGPASKAHKRDLVWWFGWITIVVQSIIAAIPWILFGGWGSMVVTLAGNLLAAMTCALPQWENEKWSGRKLSKDKTIALTRGNGYQNIMIIIGAKGSWDLETLASGFSMPRQETPWVSLALAVLWVGLLISVSGLKEHAWFLVAIGGLGVLQNIYAAGVSRDPGTAGLHLTPFTRAPTIIGRCGSINDDPDAEVDLDEVRLHFAGLVDTMPSWLNTMSPNDGVPAWLRPVEPEVATGIRYGPAVQGALVDLEKWVLTAGLAMVPLFFPLASTYTDEMARNNVHKKFWKQAQKTSKIRSKAEEKRRKESA